LSILLSIASLKYVEVSFEQALSASTPAFTALLGYVVLGKVERVIVWVTLVPVIGGALVSMKGEPDASLVGVALIFTANSLRAIKSCFQELMLVDDMVSSVPLWGWPGFPVSFMIDFNILRSLTTRLFKCSLQDPVNLLRLMSALSIPSLIFLSVIFETPSEVLLRIRSLVTSEKGMIVFLLSALCAFLVNLLQFFVTARVGALAMQVLGNGKTVFVSVISVAIFHNTVTPQGAVGYITTAMGVLLFDIARQQKNSFCRPFIRKTLFVI